MMEENELIKRLQTSPLVTGWPEPQIFAPVGSWMPTSKGLPEDFEECIVTFADKGPVPYKGTPQVACAVWFNKNWYWRSDETVAILRKYGENGLEEPIPERIEITAWMPLPEPYGEAQDEKM